MKFGILLVASLFASACSTTNQRAEAGRAGGFVTGPMVANVRTTPDTVELNRRLQPSQPAEVFAEVNDQESKITEVKLRFLHAPLEVPMKNVGKNLWKA